MLCSKQIINGRQTKKEDMTTQEICVLIISGVAAATDVKTQRIPNILPAAGMIAGIIYSAAGGMETLIDGIWGGAIPLMLLAVFFIFRMIGAGDIKLLMTLGIWLGGRKSLKLLLYTFITAAVFALIRIMASGGLAGRMKYLKAYIRSFLCGGMRGDYIKNSKKEALICLAVPVFIAVLIGILGDLL